MRKTIVAAAVLLAVLAGGTAPAASDSAAHGVQTEDAHGVQTEDAHGV